MRHAPAFRKLPQPGPPMPSWSPARPRRDEAAIRAIMQANNRRLYRLARGILRNDAEAEDVVQETYVRAFTHLESFRGDFSLATWLARIAMNEALGRLRRQRASVELDTLPPGALEAQIIQFPLSAPSEDPEKTMAQREIQHVVEHAIDELPEAFRIVFITRVIEGMNVEETAEMLGPEAGDREDPAAPRPHHAARQCGKENRPGGDGGVSVRRQALRTPDRRRVEAARPARMNFRERFAARSIQLLCINNAPGPQTPGATGVSNHVRSIERGDRRG